MALFKRYPLLIHCLHNRLYSSGVFGDKSLYIALNSLLKCIVTDRSRRTQLSLRWLSASVQKTGFGARKLVMLVEQRRRNRVFAMLYRCSRRGPALPRGSIGSGGKGQKILEYGRKS
jgi:hypothetical protein